MPQSPPPPQNTHLNFLPRGLYSETFLSFKLGHTLLGICLQNQRELL